MLKKRDDMIEHMWTLSGFEPPKITAIHRFTAAVIFAKYSTKLKQSLTIAILISLDDNVQFRGEATVRLFVPIHCCNFLLMILQMYYLCSLSI